MRWLDVAPELDSFFLLHEGNSLAVLGKTHGRLKHECRHRILFLRYNDPWGTRLRGLSQGWKRLEKQMRQLTHTQTIPPPTLGSTQDQISHNGERHYPGFVVVGSLLVVPLGSGVLIFDHYSCPGEDRTLCPSHLLCQKCSRVDRNLSLSTKRSQAKVVDAHSALNPRILGPRDETRQRHLQ